MKLFGTDGIRGTTNVGAMVPSTVLKIGQAAGLVLKEQNQTMNKVLVGKDTRLSGYVFENALVSGLCSMGVDALLVGPLPTPAIAYLTRSMRADVGFVVSASHNPYQDNGIKIFGNDGFKLDQKTEQAIEALALDESAIARLLDPYRVGKAYRMDDAAGRYISYLKSHIPKNLTFDGIRVVLDCAHGAAYKIAPTLFREMGAEVFTLGTSPDGININHKVGATHPDMLRSKVLEMRADLGFAFDGDADRILMIDDRGNIWDGDEILAFLSGRADAMPEIRDGVVGTLMSNMGLQDMFETLKIPFKRSDVGDKHVVAMMRESGYQVGGEASGHLVFLDRSTTGDGLLSSVLVMSAWLRLSAKEPLSSCFPNFKRFALKTESWLVKHKPPLESLKSLSKGLLHVRGQLDDHGRVLVRYSGTEAKLRVTIESKDQAQVRTMMAHLKACFEEDRIQMNL